MKSLGQKIAQLEGLIDTRDVSPWESGFLRSIIEKTGAGKNTTALTDRQVEVAERIWARHFA